MSLMELKTAEEDQKLSNSDLLLNAANAMLKWGKAGFSVVDKSTLEKEKMPAYHANIWLSQKKLQKLVVSKAEDKIGKRAADCTCNLCGCGISKKIRIPTESCPSKHPDKEGFTRWNEPI